MSYDPLTKHKSIDLKLLELTTIDRLSRYATARRVLTGPVAPTSIAVGDVTYRLRDGPSRRTIIVLGAERRPRVLRVSVGRVTFPPCRARSWTHSLERRSARGGAGEFRAEVVPHRPDRRRGQIRERAARLVPGHGDAGLTYSSISIPSKASAWRSAADSAWARASRSRRAV